MAITGGKVIPLPFPSRITYYQKTGAQPPYTYAPTYDDAHWLQPKAYVSYSVNESARTCTFTFHGIRMIAGMATTQGAGVQYNPAVNLDCSWTAYEGESVVEVAGGYGYVPRPTYIGNLKAKTTSVTYGEHTFDELVSGGQCIPKVNGGYSTNVYKSLTKVTVGSTNYFYVYPSYGVDNNATFDDNLENLKATPNKSTWTIHANYDGTWPTSKLRLSVNDPRHHVPVDQTCSDYESSVDIYDLATICEVPTLTIDDDDFVSSVNVTNVYTSTCRLQVASQNTRGQNLYWEVYLDNELKKSSSNVSSISASLTSVTLETHEVRIKAGYTQSTMEEVFVQDIDLTRPTTLGIRITNVRLYKAGASNRLDITWRYTDVQGIVKINNTTYAVKNGDTRVTTLTTNSFTIRLENATYSSIYSESTVANVISFLPNNNTYIATGNYVSCNCEIVANEIFDFTPTFSISDYNCTITTSEFLTTSTRQYNTKNINANNIKLFEDGTVKEFSTLPSKNFTITLSILNGLSIVLNAIYYVSHTFVYTGDSWVLATPYVYKDGKWNPVTMCVNGAFW